MLTEHTAGRKPPTEQRQEHPGWLYREESAYQSLQNRGILQWDRTRAVLIDSRRQEREAHGRPVQWVLKAHEVTQEVGREVDKCPYGPEQMSEQEERTNIEVSREANQGC